MGIRPECIHDEERYLEAFKDSTLEATVDVTELMGAEIYLYLQVGPEESDEKQTLIARVPPRSQSRGGDTIKVALDLSRLHFFDKETEQYIIH